MKAVFPCGPHLAPAILMLLLLLFPGCDREPQRNSPPEGRAAPRADLRPGCRACHDLTLDPTHDLGCSSCHGGNELAATRAEAHAGLVARPAHPSVMARTCGGCHRETVDRVSQSLHFTLRNEVNSVRQVFGAPGPLPALSAIPVSAEPATPLQLADDLLRRRCLRCHVYYPGDNYPETRRGTGCAACHLLYGNGALRSHVFVRQVPDSQCLHCHYSNTVGADYYGRYEHDFALEYRTPYTFTDPYPRPYGLEYHQLVPDLHQQAGMACIDCHGGGELMGAGHGRRPPGAAPSCEGCHGWQPGQPLPPGNIRREGDGLLLVTGQGRRLPIPPLRHPAHATYKGQATCVLCHAQWSFNDQGTHLLRQDFEDYDPWFYLTTQGCWEVEVILETSLFGSGEVLPPEMTDKITGRTRPGLWYKGFEQRRWELPLVCRDDDGRLTICRPVLDLHLSYVNAAEDVVFDAVPAQDSRGGVRPYTPHTIGRAGSFFRQRLQETGPAANQCVLDEDNR